MVLLRFLILCNTSLCGMELRCTENEYILRMLSWLFAVPEHPDLGLVGYYMFHMKNHRF